MKFITLKSLVSEVSISLDSFQTIEKALEVMSGNSISSIVIVDEDLHPIGIFTEFDALRVVSETIDKQTQLHEVMTTNPFCVEETLYLHDAYELMEHKGYRHLIVVDAFKKFVGTLSEGDFIRHIGFRELSKFKVVADIINNTPLIIKKNTSLIETATLMKNRKCDYAIVLDNHTRPIGLITERDIAKWSIQHREKIDETIELLLRDDFQVIKKDVSLQEAVGMMEKHGVHQLIVVDDSQNLIGLLSRHDLLHAIHGAYFEFLIKAIEQKNEAIFNLDKQKEELNEEKNKIEQNSLKYIKLFEALPDGVVLIEVSTMKAIEFNSAAHNSLGYSASEFAKLKISDYEQLETPEETARRINTIMEKGQDSFKTVHCTKNGVLIDVWVHVSAIHLNGMPCMIAVFRNITELENTQKSLLKRESELIEQQTFLHTLINTIPDLIWLKDTNGVYLACNEMFERLYNAKESEIIGKNDFDFVDAELATFFREHDRAAIEAGGSRTNEEYLEFGDGSYKGYFETVKTPMKNAQGEVSGVLGVARDISERKLKDEEQKLYQEKLETLANYDSLTGLANRALLMSHLQNSIGKAKRNKTQIALLMFDLDRFKDINDSYGHKSGDELLQHIAGRFSLRLRDGDLVSRIGGDEFAIVVEHLFHPEDAGRLVSEMIETLSLEYKLSAGALIHIGVSAGIALYPEDGENASDLLQHSDAALYKSKADGRGTYSYYTDELTNLARTRIECEHNLRLAIENNEFEVYYQPQVHIASGRILGAEALVRWNHPTRGLVSPDDFIPIAEELGLINQIGEFVLNETCRQGKIWLDKGYRLILAVNVSPHQIRYQNIPEMVEKALKKSGYHATHLELELTESALMQRQEEVVEMLHILRAKGIRLAIDDFGTGYSSLSYLKRFPIDVLKIDKSFIDDIPYDVDDVAIVTAIIAMGHALGFQILAEGTEREDQIDFLEAKGCTMYQGYFKSKPLPATEFEKLLLS
ncbi:MAG: EAL domain-containing protein [Sulfurimonas sp.]|jgi:diguanylate cyclase (GGDEF)-like protein/PAS domain S-box-containing protein